MSFSLAAAATSASRDHWLVAIVAFASAGFGAAVAGLITWWLQRSAWLRRARAEIYRGVLHELHDMVNDTVVRMKATEEPQSQSAEIGRRYSDLYRDATAASAKDGEMVLKFKPCWDEIGRLASEWTRAKEGKPRPEDVAVTREYFSRQLVPWEQANRALRDYDSWLREKLG